MCSRAQNRQRDLGVASGSGTCHSFTQHLCAVASVSTFPIQAVPWVRGRGDVVVRRAGPLPALLRTWDRSSPGAAS